MLMTCFSAKKFQAEYSTVKIQRELLHVNRNCGIMEHNDSFDEMGKWSLNLDVVLS